MANLTHYGQQLALRGTGTGTNGGILSYATKLKLYSGVSTPSKSGSGFTPIPAGNGYTPWTLTSGDWTFGVVSGDYRITISNRAVIAAGGVIANIAGAFITDSADNPLAWWEMVMR
jgi:hypothetical protein